MRVFFSSLLVTASCILLMTGCKKQTETPVNPSIFDYLPLQTGRVLVYRLDSTVTPPFGVSLVVKSYLLKDSIESSFTDNTGRTSFRINRYITDTLSAQGWNYLSTYYITPATTTIEVVDDNNYRFIKLAAPVMTGQSWKGNAYIDTKSAYSQVTYLDNWDYTYQNVDQPFTVNKGTLDSTLTVLQRDETIPEGPFDPNNYQQRNYSIEVYAKGIGLIYKGFLHWTWHTSPPPAAYQDGSYGIRLNLIDVK